MKPADGQLVAGERKVAEEMLRRPDRCELKAPAPTVYVYLCSGEVDEISPATAVVLTQEKVLVLWGETEVASYARRDVYFASKEQHSLPPPC